MKRHSSTHQRIEFGDWQTPIELARDLISLITKSNFIPKSIVEPTCGTGAFLLASGEQWPDAQLIGLEINEDYVNSARAALGARGRVRQADFFQVKWEDEFAQLAEPILVIGNPPWVTASKLGSLGSKNLPAKKNYKNISGLDALTGKANFDVSEWMIIRLLHGLRGREFLLSFLCKSIVARRILEYVTQTRYPIAGALHRFNAMEHFGAAVDAVALTLSSNLKTGIGNVDIWPTYPYLGANHSTQSLGIVEGNLVPDVDGFKRTYQFLGTSEPEWRSGIKHDCASVMELRYAQGSLQTNNGHPVDLENTFLYPLLKGSDVANHRWPPSRAAIIPQKRLGEDTDPIQHIAPKTWDYLSRNSTRLDSRKSIIYRNQPRFAIFGVGDYTFAPWKIAIAGLYKRLSFMLIPPWNNRPVVVDDTTYFLSFEVEEYARASFAALTSDIATSFFESLIFWEDKRPINKRILQSLDLQKLQVFLGLPFSGNLHRQGRLF